MAPTAVFPACLPITPPTTPPAAAPIIAPLSLRFIEAHPSRPTIRIAIKIRVPTFFIIPPVISICNVAISLLVFHLIDSKFLQFNRKVKWKERNLLSQQLDSIDRHQLFRSAISATLRVITLSLQIPNNRSGAIRKALGKSAGFPRKNRVAYASAEP
jgi:hypothetical protein